VTALAATGARASELARQAAALVQFEGAFFRRDIGVGLSDPRTLTRV
jgi:phosphoribosylamine-glycine ligase